MAAKKQAVPKRRKVAAKKKGKAPKATESSHLELSKPGEQVPIADIDESSQKWRTSTTDVGLEELAESLTKHGQIHAISLIESASGRRGKRWEIINGHRRFSAAQHAGLPALRANIWIYDGPADERDVAIAQHLHAANLSEPLVPLERGRMFDALINEMGLSPEQVADSFEGETIETVAEALSFLSIDERVRDVFEAHPERITEAHLRVFAEYAAPEKRGWRMQPSEQLSIARELVDQKDKHVAKDPRKLETKIRTVVNERRQEERKRSAEKKRAQTDPTKALFRQLEGIEKATKEFVELDLKGVKAIDPADKGDLLNRTYKTVEELTVMADERLAKLKVKATRARG